MLNQKQGKWILKVIRRTTDKYSGRMPLSDNDWLEFKDDLNKLYHESKNNEDVKAILLEYVRFFERLSSNINSSEVNPK